jgi:hypothetical protein
LLGEPQKLEKLETEKPEKEIDSLSKYDNLFDE